MKHWNHATQRLLFNLLIVAVIAVALMAAGCAGNAGGPPPWLTQYDAPQAKIDDCLAKAGAAYDAPRSEIDINHRDGGVQNLAMGAAWDECMKGMPRK